MGLPKHFTPPGDFHHIQSNPTYSLRYDIRLRQRFLYLSFSHHWQGRIDFNTINPSLSTGLDFLIHSSGWIDDKENVRNSGGIWKSIPNGQKISRGQSPSENCRLERNLDFPKIPLFWWSTDTMHLLQTGRPIFQSRVYGFLGHWVMV